MITVAVETEGSILQGGAPGKHRVEGIGVSFVPETFHRAVCDRVAMVTDDDAFAMVKRLAAEEGLVAGSSSGAAVHAALELARELGRASGLRQSFLIRRSDICRRRFSRAGFKGFLLCPCLRDESHRFRLRNQCESKCRLI